MDAIRKFRRAIGPESETLILVGLGIAVVLGLIYVTPNDGWPALLLPVLGCAFGFVCMLLAVSPFGWRGWREHPVGMSIRFLSLGMITGGLAMTAWAELTDRPNSLGLSVAFAGMTLGFLMDLLDNVRRTRRQRRSNSTLPRS